MGSETPIRPFVKWAGGKRRHADQIVDVISKEGFKHYFEPFLGGGAVFLSLQPPKAYLSDYNPELINAYNVIKSDRYKDLIDIIENDFKPQHSEGFYYELRSWDRSDKIKEEDDVRRAARFIYLNKTCYNGIYRVNSKQEFNVPYGKKKVVPRIIDSSNIERMHKYFKDADATFKAQDYKEIKSHVRKGDLVYFDPPYDVEKDANGFTSYTNNGFSRENQKELKELADALIERGATVVISNSHTTLIDNLYNLKPDSRRNPYRIVETFNTKRTIGSTLASRREFEEILIVGKKGGSGSR